MTKHTNVLLLTSTYPRWNGDSTPGFVAEFATHLAPHFSKVYVMAPHFPKAKRFETTQNIRTTRIRYFFPTRGETIFYEGGGITKIKKTPLYALKLASYLTSLFFNTLYITLRRSVTLINAHWIIPQGFVAILVKLTLGKPVALTVHGADILSLNGKLLRPIKRFVLKHSDVVYVNSSVTKEACEKLYKRNYVLAPMGTDLQLFQSAKVVKKRSRPFTIIFVGRLTPVKGIAYVLEATRKLCDSNRHVQTIVIGSGPLEDELHDYVTTHNLEKNVTFTGWIDHGRLPEYHKNADVFVGPSLYEAQGLVFIEALAAGLPVITTATSGAKDLITEGVNGYVVEPESSEQIFARLAQLYDTPALLRQLKKHAAASVQTTFSWTTTTAQYMQSWRHLL